MYEKLFSSPQAQEYLESTMKFQLSPEEYERFSKAVQSFKDATQSENSKLDAEVTEVLKAHPDLLQAFQAFLGDGAAGPSNVPRNTVTNTSTNSQNQQPKEPQLKVQDALNYLGSVKQASSSTEYDAFLDIMKSFKEKLFDTETTMKRVTDLFRGKTGLIEGFNTFLPPEHRIIEWNQYISSPEALDLVTFQLPQRKTITLGGRDSPVAAYLGQVATKDSLEDFLEILSKHRLDTNFDDAKQEVESLFVNEPTLIVGFTVLAPKQR